MTKPSHLSTRQALHLVDLATKGPQPVVPRVTQMLVRLRLATVVAKTATITDEGREVAKTIY